MTTIPVTAPVGRAIDAVADLLTRLRIDHLFAGSVARAAWLGGDVAGGSVDVIALLKPEQKNQVVMMATNRGFRADREEIERSEELDLIPLTFDDVRVHVLVASNALYGTMFANAREASAGDTVIKVPAAEDVALLLALSDDEVGVRAIMSSGGFDRAAYERKMFAIGLGR
ncbi:MAG TPA: hypothetical protein VG323_17655 [Thermoanaerobaculia bacterium]|nr:hypothetical protein [Thermoanaerobaculia bacterium]